MYLKLMSMVLLSAPSLFTSCFNTSKVASSSDSGVVRKTKDTISFYTLSATSLDGEAIEMKNFKGKKVIVLNVASKCGYTPQYADWQAFYEKNKDEFVVLGFPCNQFLGQEPGSAEEIESFCQKNYGVTFQMFDKIDVKGENQSAIYKWLTDPSKNGWNSAEPSWNFSKYLIDENGKLLNYFGPKIKPDSPEFIQALQ